MNCGVYRVRNTITGECYVGASSNLKQRRMVHMSGIRHRKHQSRRLRASARKYGISAFVFEVLEICEYDVLGDRELWWIKELRPEFNGTEVTVEDGELVERLCPESRRLIARRYRQIQKLVRQGKRAPIHKPKGASYWEWHRVRCEFKAKEYSQEFPNRPNPYEATLQIINDALGVRP
jgi:group I intron endonuclease